jgi:branched-chain amino acid transport system permease protein
VGASDSLSAVRSGGYLLFTFLGGATIFFGPIIGAVLLVLASVLLSELTKAWLLYLGLIFLLMVMYAPGGIASLIMMNLRLVKFRKFGRVAGAYAVLASTCVPMFFGVAALIEMVYHMQLNEALGPTMHFLGIALNVKSALSWIGVLVVAVVGLALFEIARRSFARRWGQAQGEIEATIRAGEAA